MLPAHLCQMRARCVARQAYARVASACEVMLASYEGASVDAKRRVIPLQQGAPPPEYKTGTRGEAGSGVWCMVSVCASRHVRVRAKKCWHKRKLTPHYRFGYDGLNALHGPHGEEPGHHCFPLITQDNHRDGPVAATRRTAVLRVPMGHVEGLSHGTTSESDHADS